MKRKTEAIEINDIK